MRTANDNILSNAAVTIETFSDSIDLFGVYGWALHLVWTKVTGTCAGTIRIEVSNDGTNWCTLDNTEKTMLNGDGSYFFNRESAFYRYMRIVFDVTGGTYSVDSYMNTKGV